MRGGRLHGWASRIDLEIARLALTVTQMHDNSAIGLLDPFDTGSVNLKLPCELGAGDLRVDIRCDAVTEDVPSCSVALGEGEALFSREITQIRCVWGRIFPR